MRRNGTGDNGTDMIIGESVMTICKSGYSGKYGGRAFRYKGGDDRPEDITNLGVE